VRKIAGKKYSALWELRIKLASDSFRILYFGFQETEYILLHGFTKKKDKTPVKELEIALSRMGDYLRRYRK
jgi:phage-related protein